jgi:hypothetical protein
VRVRLYDSWILSFAGAGRLSETAHPPKNFAANFLALNAPNSAISRAAPRPQLLTHGCQFALV